MRLYEGTVSEFSEDVVHNRIGDVLAERYMGQYGKSVSPSEKRSWDNSLNFVKNALDYSELSDNKIVVEYELPYSSKRIDVLLFGKGHDKLGNIVLIELKQWSNDSVHDCETEGNILVDYGRFTKEQAHPSLQVEGYSYGLQDFIAVFEETPKIELSSCSYCHNYSKSGNAVLYLPKFSKLVERYPTFSKEDVKGLGAYLKERLRNGSGLEVFDRFIHSRLKPSRRLLDHTKHMINTQQIFTLIDDQIAAYNAIMHEAKSLSKSERKSVIIVKGGPGTGKSVIALEVMGELLRKGKSVFHATGSSAFTKTLRKILGTRVSPLFKFFFSFTKHKLNEVDVLICDEAHRIRETSIDRFAPKSERTNTPQIEELIRAAKLSIFFIDEHQVVRPNEIGSIALIKSTAKKFGVDEIKEFELQTQFRCSGSDGFLQWVEDVLEVRPAEKPFLTKDDRMDFRIFKDPVELKRVIDAKNKEDAKQNSRIVAGFCWPWSEPNKDGSLVKDVVIGDFAMPWEHKNDFWKWATDTSGIEQVGTVYTAQGFEFDYIGVIFGNDLVYRKGKGWIAEPKNSKDRAVARKGNARLVEHLKNVYRVLLSRGHKGCYVYFVDDETREYFESRIKR